MARAPSAILTAADKKTLAKELKVMIKENTKAIKDTQKALKNLEKTALVLQEQLTKVAPPQPTSPFQAPGEAALA